jgi:hypothetical protein
VARRLGVIARTDATAHPLDPKKK